MVGGVRWTLSWARGHNVFMILQFQSRLTTQTTRLNPFIHKIQKAEGPSWWEGRRTAVLLRSSHSSNWKHFPFILSPPSCPPPYSDCLSIWVDLLSRDACNRNNWWFHFIASYWKVWGGREGQCRVENRNNLSRIMWRYLTPRYGLGMTILQISWVGFILTF